MEEQKTENPNIQKVDVKAIENQVNAIIAERDTRIKLLNGQVRNRNAIILWAGLTWVAVLTMRIMEAL